MVADRGHEEQPFPRRSRLLVGACLLTIVSGIYWRSISHEFLHYDDNLYVTSNENVLSGLTMRNAAYAFTSTEVGVWQPVTWISHMVDVQLFGLNPAAHHGVNLALHALNALMVFFLLLRTSRSPLPSALVAAMFAAHPLQVESVAWIAERKELLATTLALLTMGSYLRFLEKRSVLRYAAVFVLFALALMAKAIVVTLPFLLLLLDFWPLKRFGSASGAGSEVPRETRRRIVLEKVPLLVLAAAMSFVTYRALATTGTAVPFEVSPLAVRLINVPSAYSFYLTKLFFPDRLSVVYVYPQDPDVVRSTVGAVLMVLLTAVAVLQRRKRPYLLVGWLWFVGYLFPVSGIVQQSFHLVADRYAYLSCLGIFLMIAWAATDLVERRPRGRKVMVAVSVAVVLVLSAASWRQLGYWRDDAILFAQVLRNDPDNHIAHRHMGAYLANAGDVEGAIRSFRRSVQSTPAHFQRTLAPVKGYLVSNLVAEADRRRAAGDVHGAIELYREATSLEPTNPVLFYNLGNLHLALGGTDAAVNAYRRALTLDPDDPDVGTNLALALAAEREFDEAIATIEKVLEKNPDDPVALYNAACIHALQGDVQDAVARLGLALSNGFDDLEQIARDPDLELIRDSVEYLELIDSARANGGGKERRPREGP